MGMVVSDYLKHASTLRARTRKVCKGCQSAGFGLALKRTKAIPIYARILRGPTHHEVTPTLDPKTIKCLGEVRKTSLSTA